ncbi:glycosyltransferase family 2 protein [Pseudorhodoplanes sp.]|uniref:glycosyltransferase family 2 protein n=1 Tax=Pseudorhodoplanes sp. TaxID=1934341 RepID=UPI003918769D
MTGRRLAPIADRLELSIVVPVHNEADNVADLAGEIIAVLRDHISFEIVFVDDGSTDTTAAALMCLSELYPEVAAIAHDRKSGQSIAVVSGVRAARGEIIVTIDGDGQNDPKFIPGLVAALRKGQPEVGLVAGRRVGRRASRFKKLQSRIANAVRGAILRDGTTDTGCGLKAIPRDLFLKLPVFDALHRFLPALVRREGYAVVQVDVVDRDRRHGVSKYGLWNRLWVGLIDLAGVWWLIRRRRRVPHVKELKPDADRSVAHDRELFAGRVCQ